jgi:hypothetical protein
MCLAGTPGSASYDVPPLLDQMSPCFCLKREKKGGRAPIDGMTGVIGCRVCVEEEVSFSRLIRS